MHLTLPHLDVSQHVQVCYSSFQRRRLAKVALSIFSEHVILSLHIFKEMNMEEESYVAIRNGSERINSN